MQRMKLFDEEVFGAGVFVTARLRAGGRLEWERTERLTGSGAPRMAVNTM
ncbi:MAG: hypothetical protein QOF68_1207 [Gaiellales bacterium]|nr:hypothetical protein [Gaiellales bacterium]